MIDYIKVELVGEDPSKFKNHPDFQGKFKLSKNRLTGKTFPNKLEAVSKNIKARIIKSEKTNREYVRLGFSIHQYASAGKNFDDLTFKRLVRNLDAFANEYDFDLNHALIHFIEFGLNLTVPYDPRFYMKQILSYKNTPFEFDKSRPDRDGRLRLLRCDKNNFEIKFYDKKKYTPLKEERLRYEIRVKRMKHIEAIGIKTLADLKNRDKVRALGEILWQTFSKIVMVNPFVVKEQLPERERKFLNQAAHKKFWNEKKENDKKNQVYLKNKFRQLNRIYGKPDLQGNLEKKIRVKWLYQLGSDSEDRILRTLSIPLTDGRPVKKSKISNEKLEITQYHVKRLKSLK